MLSTRSFSLFSVLINCFSTNISTVQRGELICTLVIMFTIARTLRFNRLAIGIVLFCYSFNNALGFDAQMYTLKRNKKCVSSQLHVIRKFARSQLHANQKCKHKNEWQWVDG